MEGSAQHYQRLDETHIEDGGVGKWWCVGVCGGGKGKSRCAGVGNNGV